MTDLDQKVRELRALAEKATPGDLDSADHTGSGSYECPCCGGDGQAEGKTFTNFDGYAIGVQFFGVGNEFANYEACFRATTPAALTAILDEYDRRGAALVEATNLIDDYFDDDDYDANGKLRQVRAILAAILDEYDRRGAALVEADA